MYLSISAKLGLRHIFFIFIFYQLAEKYLNTQWHYFCPKKWYRTQIDIIN